MSIAAIEDADSLAIAGTAPRRHDPKWLNWPTGRTAAGLVFVILALAAALDLFFFNGYYASDDQSYYFAALRLATDGSLGDRPFAGYDRLLVAAWNLLIGRICGFDVQVMAASYVAVHLLTALSVFALARKLFNPLAAIIATWSVATFPLFVTFATGIFPDTILACLLVLSLWCFSHAYDLRRRGRRLLPGGFTFLSGLCVGLGYLAKEPGLLALPFYFFAWLLTEWKLRGAPKAATAAAPPAFTGGRALALLTGAMFALGFLAVFGAEYRLLQRLTGNPSYFRLSYAGEKNESLETAARNFKIDGGYHPWRRFEASIARLERECLSPDRKLIFLIALIAYPFLPRRRWTVFFLALWLYAYLTFGTYSFWAYQPPRLQARYYIPVFPFLLIVVAAVFAQLLNGVARAARPGRERSTLGGVLCVAFALFPFFHLQGPNRNAGRLYKTPFVRAVGQALVDAADEGARKTVVSRPIDDWITPMWYGGLPPERFAHRPPDVLSTPEIDAPRLQDLMALGRFYYVELWNSILPRIRYADMRSLDQILHPGLANQPAVLTRPAGLPGWKGWTPRYYTAVEPDDLGIIELDGRELVPRLVRRYSHGYRSRIAEIIHHFGASQALDPATFVEIRPIDLYRIDVLPSSTIDERPEELPIHRGGGDSPVLRGAFALPAQSRVRLTIEVEAAPDAVVECALAFQPAGPGGDVGAPVQRTIALGPGLNDFGFYSDWRAWRVTLDLMPPAGAGVTLRQAALRRPAPAE